MTYDFIIIGAGSAGCVLAEKLSRSGRHSVLLLEAGGSDNRFFIQMPLGYGKTFYDPQVNWCFKAEPDPGLAGNQDFWPRGKILGGSSSINAMVYIRGAREDYDDWASEGNAGWAWRDVERSFLEIEEVLQITDQSGQEHALAKAYIKAGQEAGLPFNPDFNGASQEGIGLYRLTTRKGRRNSAARAFLRPAMGRKNLTVVTHAMVTRLLFEGSKASGVEYREHGQLTTALAGREVILSAGALGSAQLLLLSGIGPVADLKAQGIEVRFANANVGRNLMDHHGINYSYRAKVPTLNQTLRPWWGKLIVGLDYLIRRRGPLSLSLNQGGGFFRTEPGESRPNMQLYMQAISTLKPKTGERPLLTPDPFPGFNLGLSNCRPTSRGWLALQSPDPHVPLKIEARAYATERDVREMLAAVKFIRHLAEQPALKSIIAEELRPGPQVQSDEDLIADFRQRSGTVYHPSGTCRMAVGADKGVVDGKLRVHGTQGLRVIDASVFPLIVTGNTNAPAMMVGAKGADIILADVN